MHLPSTKKADRAGDSVRSLGNRNLAHSVCLLRADFAWLAALLLSLSATMSAQQVAIIEHPVPTADSRPYGITAGPDGALWFTEGEGNKIAKVVFVTAAMTASPNTGVPGADVTLTASGFSPNESALRQQHWAQFAVHGHRRCQRLLRRLRPRASRALWVQ
jgi:hypothetical protein